MYFENIFPQSSMSVFKKLWLCFHSLNTNLSHDVVKCIYFSFYSSFQVFFEEIILHFKILKLTSHIFLIHL